MIGSFLRTVLAGLLIAGVVHVVAVLTIPDLAPDDAVDRVFRVAAPDEMTPIPADGSVLADLDPFFVHAACRFDVSAGPVEVVGSMPEDLWTAAVVAETEGVAGSFERGGTPDGQLEILIGRPADVERIRLDRSEGGRVLNTVEVHADRGFVLIRAFAGRRDGTQAVETALGEVRCGPLP